MSLAKFNYLSIVHDFTILRSVLSTTTSNTILPTLLTGLFGNLEYTVFKKHLKTPKTFWKINLDKSLKYHLLVNTLTPLSTQTAPILISDVLFTNQYYLPLRVANVSLHKKLYRTFLITYLFFIIHSSPKLNNNFSLPLQYYLVSDTFLLLSYYNNYFCKIYNF